MIRFTAAIILSFVIAVTFVGGAEKHLLLRQPTLSRTQIAFAYAGDIWIVSREGGEAKRLTDGRGPAYDPIFSPDGSQVAFTGEYDGNTDIYTVPASGGTPRRLTWHPEFDIAVGWTPDSRRILFRSNRSHFMSCNHLYTISSEGGFAEELPLPMAEEGSYSPDGARLAYVPLRRAFQAWKHYRGGRTTPIWLADLATSHVERIPRENSNDFQPMWVGQRVYFLSDRNGPVTLFAYDAVTRKVAQVLQNDGPDIKSASAGPGAIIYEKFGALHLFDLKSGQEHKVAIQVEGEMPEAQPRVAQAAGQIINASISPTGTGAVFEARGEILTVSRREKDVRNLTNTSGAAERDPSWSSDGKYIAFFSDESGEYALHLRETDGTGAVRKISLGQQPSFYYSPTWSPDSKKIAYLDKHLNTWYVDLARGLPIKVDTDTFADKFRVRKLRVPAWSPDSRWLAYTKDLKNHVRALFVYSLEAQSTWQVTDGMADVRFPAFDKDGTALYFTASTDFPIDSSRQIARRVYMLLLRRDLPSPFAPKGNESTTPNAQRNGISPGGSKQSPPPASRGGKAAAVDIDFEDMDQRILPLPIPALNYSGLEAGQSGVIYLLESQLNAPSGPSGEALYMFDLTKRKPEKLRDGIYYFDISRDGEKVLYRQGEQWIISAVNGQPQPSEEGLKLDGLKVRVDPRAEWKQMFHEALRIMRDFFYDPGLHGFDLKSAQEKSAPYVDELASRADLNYLLEEIFGNLSVSHLTVSGGDMPGGKFERVGLLGADYRIENGRYRFARIYTGENWNARRGPLTQPGARIAAGEYLLSVDGRDLRATDNIYSFFDGTSGKPVKLRVGPNPLEAGSREVTVVAAYNEFRLRAATWVEDNRRKVEQISGGRVAYVFLPYTGNDGYSNFNRYFYTQADKEAVVIDERFNRAGTGGESIVPLQRVLLSYISTRDGSDMTVPGGAIFGPKVMLINEYSESGGDLLAYQFRQVGIGTLVGKRTWGGLIGFHLVPSLIDGGQITVPDLAHWTANGQWLLENKGMSPDVEVEFDPEAWRAGHDRQLEVAVAVAMKSLNRSPAPQKPAYPRFYRGPIRGRQ